MKKLVALTMGSLALFANTVSIAETNQQPTLVLKVVDVSGKVRRPLEENKLSLSQKHELCWAAVNMPFLPNNQVVEVFQSPDKAKFAKADGNVVSSEDKKTHRVTFLKKSENNEYLSHCWKFDSSDPKGKYMLEVQVNNILFSPVAFEIVK